MGDVHEGDPLTERIIGAAVAVHRELGPGLLEAAYQVALGIELSHRGLAFRREVAVDVRYRGRVLPCAFRADFVVERAVVVELKTVEVVLEVHRAQLLTYLRGLGVRRGLLLSFARPVMMEGVHRVVDRY